MLYKQFFQWNWKGCSIALLMDYANNAIYQELPEESQYFASADERVYLNLRDSKDYIGEFEKLRRDDSKLILEINFKDELNKKILQGE